MRNRLFSIMAVATLLSVGWTSSAAAEEFLHGRISFADGGGLIKGVTDDDWSYATVNTLVLPTDTVWADQEGTVEVELPGGSFLRMADGSKTEFVNMAPDILVRGWTGSFYVQRVTRSSGEFVFESPAAQIRVDGNSQVRVDVVGEGSTTVSVRWGRAMLTTPGDSVPIVVSEGQRIYVDPGLLPSNVVPFDRTMEDSFDVWNRERAKLLAVGYSSVPAQISDSVIGVSDLNNYGEWVYVDNEPLWRPTVVVDYVPYRTGYWSYLPTSGYNWVADYPFGYVTSHYGRWTHHPTYGWCWGYRPGWSGAWVASVRYGSNFVWGPVGFDGYPVYYGGAHFSVGGIRFGLYSSSYCGVNDLYYGPTSVFPCRSDIFSGIHHNDIYIWNINIRNNHIGRDILPGATLRVRDYSPRRVIRGPDIAGPRAETARARITSLESSSPRGDFTRVRAASGGRDVRTAIASENRSAQVRTARVRDTDLQQTRDAVRRVLRQDQDPDSISGRGSGSGARSVRANIPEVSTMRGPRTSEGLIRAGGDEDARASRVPRPDGSRGADSARVPADGQTRTAPSSRGGDSTARVPNRGGVNIIGGDDDRGGGRGVRTLNPTDEPIASGRTAVPGSRGDDDSPRASARVDTRSSEPEQTSVPDRGNMREPRSDDRPSTRVPDRVSDPTPTTRSEAPTRTEVPDRTPAVRTEEPSRGHDRSEAPTRTEVPDRAPEPRIERTPEPRVERSPEPDRSFERSTPQPETRESTPDRSSSGHVRGSRSESRVTVPRQTVPPRQTYSQSTPAPRMQTSPTVRQSTPAPRQESRPSVTTVRPRVESAPSVRQSSPAPRSYSPPQVSSPPSRSYSAPSRSYSPPASSQRSIAPSPSRSYERSAPSVSAPRSSSPSMSTPSSGSSSPSFSAPSGGSRGSGSAISGSRGSSSSSRGGGRSR